MWAVCKFELAYFGPAKIEPAPTAVIRSSGRLLARLRGNSIAGKKLPMSEKPIEKRNGAIQR